MATVLENVNELDFQSPQTSVVELVLDAQNGDRDALDTLIERYEGYVHGLTARYVDNFEDRAEICQEVLILLIKRLHQLQVPQAFSSWLRRITHRTAINYCRRRRLVWNVEPETLDSNVGRETDPAQRAEDREVCRLVHDGLDHLNPSDRSTLVAFYLDNRSLLQMADDFQAPVGTIKRRLHVARKRLAKQLEDMSGI